MLQQNLLNKLNQRDLQYDHLCVTVVEAISE